MLSFVATHPTQHKTARIALYTGATSAILASTCHHISFLLSTFGLSSAKILYIVTLTDWARPFLILVALISLFISYKDIWHIFFSYKPSRDNEISWTMVIDKVFFLFVAMVVIIVLMLPYFAPCAE
jgi:MerT mercuric transport protein